MKLKNPLMQLSVTVSAFALSGSAAYAQQQGGTTLANVTNAASNNIYSITTLISTGSYVCGAAFGVGGLLAVKKHTESPNEPLGKGIGKIAVGAALCAFPSVLGIAINSMGISPNQGVGVTGSSTNRLNGS